MKAADYRIPWGRPSEHLLAVKREIIGQQLHVQRVRDARNRSTIDTEPPECTYMPHLITRPKKKKVRVPWKTDYLLCSRLLNQLCLGAAKNFSRVLKGCA